MGVAVKFNETGASCSSSNYLGLPFLLFHDGKKKVPEVIENSPTAAIKFAALGVKSLLWACTISSHFFCHVVIIGYAVKDSPPALLKCCANDTPVCSQFVTVPPVLDCHGPLHTYLLLKESFIICLSNSYSKVHGKLAVRACEVGQLHFSEKR